MNNLHRTAHLWCGSGSMAVTDAESACGRGQHRGRVTPKEIVDLYYDGWINKNGDLSGVPIAHNFRYRRASCAFIPATTSAGRTALVAVGLVQLHSWDLSTSNSPPGEDGSKPCSISQRAACRLRSDHHARITSRSTSVP
jgi:hypothetical protein